MTDELDYADAADAVYRSLLERVGEAAPERRLDATRRAVEILGDPHRAAPVIHITGTNGKTSTSRMIESILRAGGLRTGLMTSPHLERFTERILIDGVPVSDEAVARNWEEIEPFIAIVDAELDAAGTPRLTFFETLTALAFACFADAPVDVVVLEVGMGGEWDSTNVADGQVAVFTPIDLDHESALGTTIEEIARTKAGIIKPEAAVVTAFQSPEALTVLRDAATEQGGTFAVEGGAFAVLDSRVAVGGQLISVKGLAGEYRDLALPLFGRHQAENAAVAIAAVESFLGAGTMRMADEVLQHGLGAVTSPGRLQMVGTEPPVLVDAAHNPHGARALVAALDEYFDFDEVVAVVGVLRDKDAKGIITALDGAVERFNITTSSSERSIPVDELALAAVGWSNEDKVFQYDDLLDALDDARKWAAEAPKRAVVVTGSIVLVGEAIAIAADREWGRS
ncbi:bifunctional folylpolyglutamate synthase/dihydrofolate synthase [Agromyces cerinus]|uniref:tetrahydrofolate synthase n=1 Tax=Agromyces cerinus subsp. cerinus TaxID=232089 RepID=A0A1N6DVK9_9MICO|nr:folylpolyglutamate synthase/dihydrofolate synthase family protein [Agromyces cerinus]SIN74826.1 dihydrofolate synthase / folylpolyglutamate synthase [Agromyces cerinus subsp. cerinus]